MNTATYAEQERPLSTGGWMVTLFVLALPVVNIIMYLVWALGGDNLGRRNFCRASILWFLIALAVSVVFFLVAAMLGAPLAISSSPA